MMRHPSTICLSSSSVSIQFSSEILLFAPVFDFIVCFLSCYTGHVYMLPTMWWCFSYSSCHHCYQSLMHLVTGTPHKYVCTVFLCSCLASAISGTAEGLSLIHAYYQKPRIICKQCICRPNSFSQYCHYRLPNSDTASSQVALIFIVAMSGWTLAIEDCKLCINICKLCI